MVTPRSFRNGCGVLCAFWCLGLGLPASWAQDVFNTDAKRDRVLEVAREIARKARYCALITIDRSGRPAARTMYPLPPETDFVVWMATNPASEKVRQISRDPHVTLYYFDPDSQGYVSLMGRAQLVNDAKDKAKHWAEAWNQFYPNRESAILIVVTPEKLQMVSVKHKIFGDRKTSAPPTVEFERPPAKPKEGK
jgi:general stress protein 26